MAKAEQIFYNVLYGIFIVFFGYVLITDGAIFIEKCAYIFTEYTKVSAAVFLLYFFLLLYAVAAYHFLLAARKLYKTYIFLFLSALAPRLIFAFLYAYRPTSDFLFYYNGGVAIAEGNFSYVTERLSVYGAVELSGIAFAHSILCKLFSPHIIVFQIFYSAVTSFICLLIYKIAKQINEKIAIIAALLYAFYPASIASAQVPTNQHLATLLNYTVFYILLQNKNRSFKKSMARATGAGLLLAVGYFMHPSTYPILLAIICFLVAEIVFERRLKKNGHLVKKQIFLIFTTIISFYIFAQSFEFCARKTVAKDVTGFNFGWKFVAGFNNESLGFFNYGDYDLMQQYKNSPDENKIISRLIKERTNDKGELWSLLQKKAVKMWSGYDSIIDWVFVADINEYQEMVQNNTADNQIITSLNNIKSVKALLIYSDTLYTNMIYALAIVGVCIQRKKISAQNLLLWSVLGWVSCHLLIEIQQRYRYFAMPTIFIFSAVGLYYIACFFILNSSIFKRIQI